HLFPSCSIVILLSISHHHSLPIFFFHDPAPTHTSTLSLHDALPILQPVPDRSGPIDSKGSRYPPSIAPTPPVPPGVECYGASARSEEHTSELQSRENLVCRLLLEKKNKN